MDSTQQGGTPTGSLGWQTPRKPPSAQSEPVLPVDVLLVDVLPVDVLLVDVLLVDVLLVDV
ncbi:MAG: hypothetical protein JST54_35855, partial [Deltaproteobacteria bacterium]|nr:hypothetical protein [Deltaproteobacteria bacterium]